MADDIICRKFIKIVSRISHEAVLGDEGEFTYFFFDFEDACHELGFHPRSYKFWRTKISEMAKDKDGNPLWIHYSEGCEWRNKGEYFWWLSEEGLFYLLLQSKTDAAKQFQKWVVEDVLMAIEKTASYPLKIKNENEDKKEVST